jgi:hypothetical protein
VIQSPVKLIDGMRPKRIPNLGPVEGHPHCRLCDTVEDVAVVGDVGEVLEAWHGIPQ